MNLKVACENCKGTTFSKHQACTFIYREDELLQAYEELPKYWLQCLTCGRGFQVDIY